MDIRTCDRAGTAWALGWRSPQGIIDHGGIDPVDREFSINASNAVLRITAIVALVFVALWALFLWFAWKGHDWARFSVWILAGLSLFGTFDPFSTTVRILIAIDVVRLLLIAAAVLLLGLKPSGDWYRYQGDARRYNWPDRA